MSNRIAESELIINDRGAVYHLNIRPEELAHTVITVGDPDRVALISRHFDRIEFRNAHREFISHTGYIGKKRITVLSTGIGPDNIDIALNELDALVNIDFTTREIKKELTSLHIIRIGTSGSLQGDIPVDSFVAGTHGLGLDNVLHFYRNENNEHEKELLNAFVNHTNLNGDITPYICMAGNEPALPFRGRLPSGNYGYLPGIFRSARTCFALGAHLSPPHRPADHLPLRTLPYFQF